METNDKLARSNRELAETVKSLAKPSELTLLSELDMTATNSKTVMEPRLSAEFLRVLSEFPAEAVQSAFRAWRDESEFFPAISHIRDLCVLWVRRQAEAQLEAAVKQEREELDEARARGELVPFADIIKRVKEIGKGMPSVHAIKQAYMRMGPITPAVQLTRQQIEERRAKEIEEIRKYEEKA